MKFYFYKYFVEFCFIFIEILSKFIFIETYGEIWFFSKILSKLELYRKFCRNFNLKNFFRNFVFIENLEEIVWPLKISPIFEYSDSRRIFPRNFIFNENFVQFSSKISLECDFHRIFYGNFIFIESCAEIWFSYIFSEFDLNEIHP